MSSSSSESETSEYREGDTFRKLKERKDEEAEQIIQKSLSKKEGKPTKSSKVKATKDWTDEEITLLIEILEANPCLWNIYDPSYSKKDAKEIAYSEIATNLNTTITSVKSKINGLRAQLGREMVKEKTTRSGQSTDELYRSTWPHYDKLFFLIPVIKSAKSRDTMSRKRNAEDEKDLSGKESPSASVPKKKTLAEKKLDLLTKCTEAMTSKATPSKDVLPPPPIQNSPKVSHFTLYIDEKLSQLDQRTRRLTEKRISDIIFEAEMSMDSQGIHNNRGIPQPFTAQHFQPRTPGNQSEALPHGAFQTPSYFNGQESETYMGMLNNT